MAVRLRTGTYANSYTTSLKLSVNRHGGYAATFNVSYATAATSLQEHVASRPGLENCFAKHRFWGSSKFFLNPQNSKFEVFNCYAINTDNMLYFVANHIDVPYYNL